MTTSIRKPQNALNFFKKVSSPWTFCKSLVACCKLTSSSGRFPAKPIFLALQLWKNCGKILMEYTSNAEPQFAESKKPKQNRVKSRKHDFVETYFLNILKSCVLLLQFLKIFLYSFMFSTTLLSHKQKYRVDR